MWITIGLTCGFLFLVFLLILTAKKSGAEKERVKALKEEIKKISEEQARANTINNSIDNMSIDDIRKRLRNIQSK